MYYPVVKMSPVFGFEMKRKQHSYEASVLPTMMYSIRSVYIMRVYVDNVVSNFWFLRSFSSLHNSKLIANFTSEIVFQVCTKECKARSFIGKLNLNFMHSSRHFKFDTVFAVIVPFLNERVHDFNKIRNGRVKNTYVADSRIVTTLSMSKNMSFPSATF